MVQLTYCTSTATARKYSGDLTTEIRLAMPEIWRLAGLPSGKEFPSLPSLNLVDLVSYALDGQMHRRSGVKQPVVPGKVERSAPGQLPQLRMLPDTCIAVVTPLPPY